MAGHVAAQSSAGRNSFGDVGGWEKRRSTGRASGGIWSEDKDDVKGEKRKRKKKNKKKKK